MYQVDYNTDRESRREKQKCARFPNKDLYLFPLFSYFTISIISPHYKRLNIKNREKEIREKIKNYFIKLNPP